MGEQGLGSTLALTVLHWHNKLLLHSPLLGRERANGLWWGSVLPQSLSSERKSSCTRDLGCGSPSGWDTVPAAAVSLWTDMEAALPTVELPAKLQTCRTAPWLSAKSSQSLAEG